jgi:alanine-glyoxylate transaminase/serine-glyoxylate transaminase/serine-pyruvate transaminase
MTIKSHYPPLRTLLGPGPSDVPARVLQALARPTVGHLDPSFLDMMDELKRLLQYAFQTQNPVTLAISGPGSAGMETCFVNLLEPGDTAVVCLNGVFGTRMRENVERCGAEAVVVDMPWGRAVDPSVLEDVLKRTPKATVVAFVHGETSTGVLSDARALAQVAQQHGCLTIMDAVTSLGGCPVLVDEWGIDAAYSGSQKCLSCTPGLSPVTFSERAMDRLKRRRRRVQSWFMDLGLLTAYWGSNGQRVYHHTAPINALYGLHEALLMLREEGLETAWSRHRENHEALRTGIEAMGLDFLVEEAERLPQLNAVRVPPGVEEAELRRRLLQDYGIEIGAGLGALAGRIWRIGLMGYGSTARNVRLVLGALQDLLGELQVSDTSDGSAAGPAKRADRLS